MPRPRKKVKAGRNVRMKSVTRKDIVLSDLTCSSNEVDDDNLNLNLHVLPIPSEHADAASSVDSSCKIQDLIHFSGAKSTDFVESGMTDIIKICTDDAFNLPSVSVCPGDDDPSGNILDSVDDVIVVTDISHESKFTFNPPNRVELEYVHQRLGTTLSSGLPYKIDASIPCSGYGLRLSPNFQTKSISGDGNCFFRAVSCALTGNESLYHMDLRQRLVHYENMYIHLLEPHMWSGESTDEHIRLLGINGTYARDSDIVALASMIQSNIFVYSQVPSTSGNWSWLQYKPEHLFPVDESNTISIYLVNTNSNHFDLVHRMDSIHSVENYLPLNICSPNVNVEPKLKLSNERKSREQHRASNAIRNITRNRSNELQNNSKRRKLARANATPIKTAERLEKSKKATKLAISNELLHITAERLEKMRECTRLSRLSELPQVTATRVEKNAECTKLSRSSELPHVTALRVEKNAECTRLSRSNELPGITASRLDKSKKYHQSAKMNETYEQTDKRLKANRTIKASIRASTRSSLANRLAKVRTDIEKNTHFVFLCCSDMRYHCRGNVTKLKLMKDHEVAKSKLTERELKDERLRNNTFVNEFTKSYDGFWYICHSCKKTLQKGNVPPCNEVEIGFQVDDLPEHLRTEDMKLNKCEAHLLKLIIPFVRVAHIPRSAEFKVSGPMICVEALVNKTVEIILPIDQNLIPVCLKRLPHFKGNYIQEVVSKSKVLKYFDFFKANNPLFADIVFSREKLDQFLNTALDDITEQDEWKSAQNHDVADVERQIFAETEERQSEHTHASANFEDTVEQKSESTQPCDSRKAEDDSYDLPNYLTEISHDTVVDPLTKCENREDMSEILANAIIEQERTTAKTKNKSSRKMTSLNVAPTAEGKFTHWGTAVNLEEKAFPHLFPTGKGGFLSTYQPKKVGFANYVKQRMLGLDPRFRDDSIYMFFLFMVKEQLEIKRSYATFFRKSKTDRVKYDTKFLRSADKAEIERFDVGYKAFKNVRGTAPYFQQVKQKVMAMIRQLGTPNLFLTMSAAESHWSDLLRMLVQRETNTVVPLEDVEALSRTEINKLLTRNVVHVNTHFSSRMKILYGAFKKSTILSKYKVDDHFFRIEFQQRGAPHVHSLLWLKDEDGNSPPLYDGSEESKKSCAEFIDSLISGKLPPTSDDSHETVRRYQSHAHTFTCRKKSRKIKIQRNEGHGRYDGVREGPELILDSCRFKFPKFPMRNTMIIERPGSDINPEEVKKWKDDYCKIRKFIMRQTHTIVGTESNGDFQKMTFDEFLEALSLTELDYINALRMCAATNRSNAELFLHRDCCDLFTNNYNPNILKIHRANMDLSFVIDEYACVAYILGYLTKNESGLSRLLHEIEIESTQYGRSPQDKMKLFSRALDNSREVSRPEVVYRMLSLHFCATTRTHAFVQCSHPKMRDGLLRSNLELLEDDDNPFFNSIIDYYVNRPDDFENISLAEFVRDNSIVYQAKAQTDADNHLNMDKTDDYCVNEMAVAPGKIRWLKNKIGRFRGNKKYTIVRYHLSKNNDLEIKRNLLLLFHPFRDEMKEIHEPHGRSLEDVYDHFKDDIEDIRNQFEPNRNLLLHIEKAMEGYDENDDVEDDMLYEDEVEQSDLETTSDKDLAHFLSLAIKCHTEIDVAKKETVCAMIRQLNHDQRGIFDDVLDRLVSQNQEGEMTNPAVPFYLYISGNAGCGKSFLLRTLVEAAKLIFMKSGDDLSKPTVLVMSPTASAARLIDGQTIESAMKLWRSDDTESYETFSNNATCAYEYSQVKAIFIDEVSMVGSNKFHNIHLRCEQIFGKREVPFSALTIICTGDFLQLPPVLDSWIFGNTTRQNRCDATAPNMWKLHFKMYELVQKMRSLEDPNFSALCDRIGTNTIDVDDELSLRHRIVQCPNEEINDVYKNGKLAIIVRDNATRENINTTKLSLIEGDPTTFGARDVCTNANRYNEQTVNTLPYTRTGSLPYLLKLKINAPVMLTVNTDKSDGLTNGARGYVVDINQERGIIWVKFSANIGTKSAAIGRRKHDFRGERGAVPITRMKASFGVNPGKGSVRIQRSQFSLVPAYAITAHKSQGQTLDEVIVDFSGKGSTTPGSFYVSVTRVKKLSNLYLKNYDRSMITTSPAVLLELTRLNNHAKYKFYKVPLCHNMFENNDANEREELKIVYLNINGLLHANHIRDLDSDLNLKSADFICIAETKLSDAVSDASLIVSNYDVICRLDFKERSMGLILYKRTDSNATCRLQDVSNYTVQKTQLLQCDINDLSFCFTYLHPSCVGSGFLQLEKKLRIDEFVIGDLNTDYLTKSGISKVLEFCQNRALFPSSLGPTHNQAQLDHILLPNFIGENYSYHTQAFANLYSDHNAVCLRILRDL